MILYSVADIHESLVSTSYLIFPDAPTISYLKSKCIFKRACSITSSEAISLPVLFFCQSIKWLLKITVLKLSVIGDTRHPSWDVFWCHFHNFPLNASHPPSFRFSSFLPEPLPLVSSPGSPHSLHSSHPTFCYEMTLIEGHRWSSHFLAQKLPTATRMLKLLIRLPRKALNLAPNSFLVSFP